MGHRILGRRRVVTESDGITAMPGNRHDLASYMPFAAGHYRHSGPIGGGAELQTVLLARALVNRGVSVAHIVCRIEDPALHRGA